MLLDPRSLVGEGVGGRQGNCISPKKTTHTSGEMPPYVLACGLCQTCRFRQKRSLRQGESRTRHLQLLQLKGAELRKGLLLLRSKKVGLLICRQLRYRSTSLHLVAVHGGFLRKAHDILFGAALSACASWLPTYRLIELLARRAPLRSYLIRPRRPRKQPSPYRAPARRPERPPWQIWFSQRTRRAAPRRLPRW